MNLPTELMQATIEALRLSSGADNLSDVRVDARHRLLGSATIIPCSPSSRSSRVPVAVGVCDLSSAGIGFVHKLLLRVGEEFILAIPATSMSPRRAALFTVIHWQEQADGTFRIGASLLRELRTGSPDDGRSPAGVGSMPARKLTPVEGLAAAFRKQATSGLTSEEAEQLRQLERRLASVAIA